MCSTTAEQRKSTTKTVESSAKPCNSNETETKNGLEHAKNQLRTGTLYGSLSLALLVLSFSLTLPHMQSRRDALGCDSLCLGSMTSARSTLQLLGSALMGRFSDSAAFASWGGARKLCLLVGALASLLGVAIAGGTFSIRGMWISMIPGALFQQNFNVLKALFSDYHDVIKDEDGTSDRAGSLGMLGMSAGLAFMAGPLAGAMLLKTYEQATTVAIVSTIISTILILQIPVLATTPNKVKTSTSPPNTRTTATTTSGFGGFLDIPSARFLMMIRACMALAFHIFSTIWTVSLKERFDFGPRDHGKFMSFVGLTYALSQGVGAKYILNKVGVENHKGRVRVLLLCNALFGIGRYVAFQTSSLATVYVAFAGIIMARGVVDTVLTADTSRTVSSKEIGGLYGILAAVESGAGMLGPILGGAVAYVDPIQAPLFAVIGLYTFVFCLIGWGYERYVLQKVQEKKSI